MNKNYLIRPAEWTDIPRVMEIYEIARRFMCASGNPTQWAGGYPWQDLLEDDIAAGNLYVVCSEETIHGVFAFILGDDPTYARIENGSWRSTAPYGTIHRIAGDGSGGIFPAALNHCRSVIDHLRIDTHGNNKPMQHVVAKYGFSRRGIIYVEDGTPRIAYDRIEREDHDGISQ